MKKTINWSLILFYTMLVIMTLLIIAFITLQIYALINYGGKPADEIPGWVWWLWNKE